MPTHYKLIQRIMKISIATNWDDARKEWSIDQIYYDEDGDTCLCGHNPIKEVIIILNKINKKFTIIGNCCVNVVFNKDHTSIFNALRQNKINRKIIDHGLKQGWLNLKEYRFACDVWRCRILSKKQHDWFEKIRQRLVFRMKRGDYK